MEASNQALVAFGVIWGASVWVYVVSWLLVEIWEDLDENIHKPNNL